jgi:hypothetical protein
MNKTFDCVEMKHQGAEKIRKRIGKLTPKEELQFWKEMTASLNERKSRIEGNRKVKA